MNVTSVKLTIFTNLGDTHSKPIQYLGQHFRSFLMHFYTSEEHKTILVTKTHD